MSDRKINLILVKSACALVYKEDIPENIILKTFKDPNVISCIAKCDQNGFDNNLQRSFILWEM